MGGFRVGSLTSVLVLLLCHHDLVGGRLQLLACLEGQGGWHVHGDHQGEGRRQREGGVSWPTFFIGTILLILLRLE